MCSIVCVKLQFHEGGVYSWLIVQSLGNGYQTLWHLSDFVQGRSFQLKQCWFLTIEQAFEKKLSSFDNLPLVGSVFDCMYWLENKIATSQQKFKLLLKWLYWMTHLFICFTSSTCHRHPTIPLISIGLYVMHVKCTRLYEAYLVVCIQWFKKWIFSWQYKT